MKAPVDASGSGTLVVRAGRVFTARDETDPDVVGLVVREGKIQALLSPADPLPPGADVVDFGPDATLLPGLIDCHVHLTGTRTYGGSAPAPPYLRAARAVADLEALLRAGYTTVRDLGSAIALGLREAVLEGSVSGPRILAAGPIVSQTGGHADQHALPEAYVRAYAEDSLLADGPHEVRLAVRRVARLSADVVKICTTGGVGSQYDSPHDAHYTPEEIRAAVEEAHRLGRRVAAHAQGALGVLQAVEGGVDTVEHGYYLDDRCVEAMARRQVVLVPTLALRRVYRQTLESGVDMPPWRRRKQAEAVDAMLESVQKAYRAGVPIASGSDFFGAPGREHGKNALDIMALAEAGLSPRECLLAATRTAARALGVDDQVGSLAPGYSADAVVVRGNPLEDLEVLRTQVQAVMQGGRLAWVRDPGAALPRGPLPRLMPSRPA